jgi:hypothetical protein
MRKATPPSSEPGIFTVGDLIGELCRWPDHAAVSFRCPLKGQQLRFNHIEGRSKGRIEIELDQEAESPSDAHVTA